MTSLEGRVRRLELETAELKETNRIILETMGELRDLVNQSLNQIIENQKTLMAQMDDIRGEQATIVARLDSLESKIDNHDFLLQSLRRGQR